MSQDPVRPEDAQAALDAWYACDGNKSQAARSLGLKRNTYTNRYDAALLYGLEPNSGASSAMPSPMGPVVQNASACPRTYVVTTAQNATPVDEGFVRALHRFCEHRNATLLVIPFRYKNVTSVWTPSQSNADWWHAWIADQLISEDVGLNANLTLAASIMIQPTAKRPLSGMQTYTGGSSAIFGHSKIELETVATPQNRLPKILTTTGACTVENYTDSKAGKLGEHHHMLGATVVEVEDEKRFHVRQINACTDGSFIDLDEEFTPAGVRKAGRPEVMTCADIHHKQMDPTVEHATFASGGIVDTLRPKRLVFHDLLDFKSQNHHDERDFVEKYRKYRIGWTGVYDEVRDTLAWLRDQSEYVDEAVVVESNHNEAFMRWLNDGRGDKDPENAWFYHNTWAGILPAPGSENTEVGHPLEYWFYQLYPGNDCVRFLRRNDAYMVGDVDYHMHGDVGSNGSKGSVLGFNRIGVKNTVAHGHGPAIHGGTIMVGVMQLRMRYNENGPSNWLPAHEVQYANGKRTLIAVIDGRWRARTDEERQ